MKADVAAALVVLSPPPPVCLPRAHILLAAGSDIQYNQWSIQRGARREKRSRCVAAKDACKLLVMLLHIVVCMDVWSKITLRSTILLQAGACDAIHTHTTVSHASRTKPGVTDVKCRLASSSLM